MYINQDINQYQPPEGLGAMFFWYVGIGIFVLAGLWFAYSFLASSKRKKKK